MTCKCVSQKLDGYVDGELTGIEMLAVRTHLRHCVACQNEAETVRELKTALASLPCHNPSPDFEERLFRVVRQEMAPTLSMRRPAFVWSSALAGAAAAGFAIVWFGVLHAPEKQPSEVASKPIQETTAFELSRDQAFTAASDPLSGQSMVVSTSYGNR